MRLMLSIEKAVHGGDGLAHADGRVVFVKGALPGERVSAEVTGSRAQSLFARAAEIVEASPDRVRPFCPHFGACGGCDWQHIRYERQVGLKKEILEDCLRRIGKIGDMPAIEVISGPSQRYRHRAQFQIDPQSGAAGFFRRESNEVEPVDSCPLLVPELDSLLKILRTDAGLVPSGTTRVMAIAGENNRIASTPVIPGHTDRETAITVNGVSFLVSGGGFFQQNRPLMGKFGGWPGGKVGGKSFVELYGGTGLFSALLAPRFSRGLLIEADDGLASLARENFQRNNLANLTARAMTAERFFARPIPGDPPDCLIVDPPRQGLSRAVREGIAALRPPAIVYVSCDPATQARDIGFLMKQAGYAIDAVALFDLYPQTWHVETIIILKKRVDHCFSGYITGIDHRESVQ